MKLGRAVAHAFYGGRTGLREAQERALEPILSGQDTLVVAGTGSGKTEAVIAPLIERFHAVALEHEGQTTFLYLSPTKALANDMASRLEGPLAELHLTVGRRHGDRNDLTKKAKPHFVITTPESLDNELVRHQSLYRGVHAVVIDEVHQLAGSQRGLQLAVLLIRLERWLGRPVQAVGMSATLAAPQDAWEQLRPGHACHVIEAQSRRERVFVLRRAKSEEELASFLERTAAKGKVLAFARSRGETESVAASIGQQSAFGHRVYVHHSSLDTAVREQVERDLKGNDATLCVATSTLELGIDIGDINLVVLLGAPADWRSLEQRIGRTNRRSDRTDVIGIVPPKLDYPLLELAYFMGLIGQADRQLQRDERSPQLFGALGQQAFSIVRQSGDWTHVDQFIDVLGKAPGLTADDVLQILDGLVEGELLRRHPVRNALGAGPLFEAVLDSGDAWGNFPASSQVVHLFESNRRMGEVAMSPHNAKLLQPGNIVAYRGRAFEVDRLVRGREVHLRPSTGKPQDKLRFGGNSVIRDPYLVTQLPQVFASAEASEHLGTAAKVWWQEASAHLGALLVPGQLTWWRGPEGVGHATFAGLWINQILLALHGGVGRAGEVVVHLPRALEPQSLPPFEALDDLALQQSPRVTGLTSWQKLLPPRLLAEEILSSWHADPIYERTWDALSSAISFGAADARLAALG